MADYLNKIIQGDVLDVLKTLPAGIVQTVITSPPYWGLRDYGTAQWDGGDKNCDHRIPEEHFDPKRSGNSLDSSKVLNFNRDSCNKCGAVRMDQQIGLETTPELYVEKMVAIFREIWRVLRADGTAWVNMGDSYAHNGPCGGSSPDGDRKYREADKEKQKNMEYKVPNGLKPKDLCGTPWRLAFALQADGWFLRSDIIWNKPNPIPESVTDRPTKAHEYIFLLTKKPKYYYDADAVREPYQQSSIERRQYPDHDTDSRLQKHQPINREYETPSHIYDCNSLGRNRRTVWEIATQSYSEAHFATFPEKLVEPCILAGSAEKACGICGAPWERVVDIKQEVIGKSVLSMGGDAKRASRHRDDHPQQRTKKHVKTLGFRPTCEHDNGEGKSIALDPFMGSGTVAKVALRANRNFIGIELNQEYIDMAMKRIGPLLKQGNLL